MPPTPDELTRSHQWLRAHLTSLHPDALLFSFDLDGRPFSECAQSWAVEIASREVDGRRTGHEITRRDPPSVRSQKAVR
jgi:hypothetical protein